MGVYYELRGAKEGLASFRSTELVMLGETDWSDVTEGHKVIDNRKPINELYPMSNLTVVHEDEQRLDVGTHQEPDSSPTM